jgi:hypothetical protein
LTVLDETYRQYGHIHQLKLLRMTCELKSYQKNKPQKGETMREFPYEDFFEDYDEKPKAMLAVVLDEQQAWADVL